MEVENSQIWDRIAHSVLEDDYEEYSQLYHIRLKFLYSMMLEEINETNALDTLEFLIDEIIGYENSQKYMSSKYVSRNCNSSVFFRSVWTCC